MKEVFEINKYIKVPDSYRQCSICKNWNPSESYEKDGVLSRTNCQKCYETPLSEWEAIKKRVAKKEEAGRANIKYTCECCDVRFFQKDILSRDPVVCYNCGEHLEDKTGYCSMSCRLSGVCDGSC